MYACTTALRIAIFLPSSICCILVCLIPACHRNQIHQEQLWEISCNLLKDYISPDIWREYGPSETEQQTGEATASGTGEELQEPPKSVEEPKQEGTTKGDNSEGQAIASSVQPTTKTEQTESDD